MLKGRHKAIIEGKEREIEMLMSQLEESKAREDERSKEIVHLREQLERVYNAILGLNKVKLNSPKGGSFDGLGG